jgi:hypothetical protein
VRLKFVRDWDGNGNEESDEDEVGDAPIIVPASTIRACHNPLAKRLVIGLLCSEASKRNACPQKDGARGLKLCRIALELYLSTEDITNLGSSAQALLRLAFNPEDEAKIAQRHFVVEAGRTADGVRSAAQFAG